jgi:hypothetical protein
MAFHLSITLLAKHVDTFLKLQRLTFPSWSIFSYITDPRTARTSLEEIRGDNGSTEPLRSSDIIIEVRIQRKWVKGHHFL